MLTALISIWDSIRGLPAPLFALFFVGVFLLWLAIVVWLTKIVRWPFRKQKVEIDDREPPQDGRLLLEELGRLGELIKARVIGWDWSGMKDHCTVALMLHIANRSVLHCIENPPISSCRRERRISASALQTHFERSEKLNSPRGRSPSIVGGVEASPRPKPAPGLIVVKSLPYDSACPPEKRYLMTSSEAKSVLPMKKSATSSSSGLMEGRHTTLP